MSTLNVTQNAVSSGIEHCRLRSDHPLVLDILNMNISYCLIDLCIVYIPDPNILFIAHHLMVAVAGTAIKHVNEGAAVWLIAFCYSDLPTIIFHSLWFARNIGKNLKALIALFDQKSVKESKYINEQMTEALDVELHKNINLLDKIEKVLFLGFSASFLYVRCFIYSKTIPFWVWNSWQTNIVTLRWKIVASSSCGILMGVSYVWSYKLVMKMKEIIYSKEENESNN